MPSQKIIAVLGATGAQGGGLVQAIAADPTGEFVARAITRASSSTRSVPASSSIARSSRFARRCMSATMTARPRRSS